MKEGVSVHMNYAEALEDTVDSRLSTMNHRNCSRTKTKKLLQIRVGVLLFNVDSRRYYLLYILGLHELVPSIFILIFHSEEER